jgi:hypothetical protein
MIRHFFIALASLAGLLSANVAAQDSRSVRLQVGEQVVVIFDEAGFASASPGGAARISDEEQAGILKLVMENPSAVGPNAAGASGDDLNVSPVTSGSIRISFITLASVGEPDDRLLVLENGYDRAFRYRATISQGSRSEPTDVCTVIPMLRGYEHWPFQIDRIELTNLTLVSFAPGQQPVCE